MIRIQIEKNFQFTENCDFNYLERTNKNKARRD